MNELDSLFLMSERETPGRKHTYVHFDNIEKCEAYILNNSHLRVSHLCCGGRGIAIERVVQPVQKAQKTTTGTCDICFLENIVLIQSCQTCIQPFCQDCLDKLVTKTCPYCRGKLNNNP
jgi:hypothetical protein